MNRLVIHGHVCDFSGWGRLTERVGQAIEAEGLPVAVWPSLADDWFLPHTDWMEGHRIARPEPGEFVLSINPPWIEVKDRPFGVLTMWEVDRLPPKAAERLNRARFVATPSQWGVECFRASGVTAPLHAVPLAAGNPHVAPRATERPPGPFVFGCAGRWESGGVRKGIADVFRAFEMAFPSDPDVRLHVKCWPDCVVPLPRGDDRIIINRTPLSDEDMAEWYRGLDCYVTASRGEGWGFQAFEAMASGVPVLGCFQGGSAAFLDGTAAWPVDYTLGPADGVYATSKASWAVPSVEHMVAQLRTIASSPGEAAEKGRAAAIRTLWWTWEQTAKDLLRLIQS